MTSLTVYDKNIFLNLLANYSDFRYRSRDSGCCFDDRIYLRRIGYAGNVLMDAI